MRILHELIADEYVEDTSLRVPKAHWQAVLGGLDTLKFLFIVDRVSGGSPTFFANLLDGPDLTNKGTLFNSGLGSTPLVVGQPNAFTFSLSANDAFGPGSHGYTLFYGLGGTSPKAHVRGWVTGRGRI